MELDTSLLLRFEKGLNPRNLKASAVPAEILGYGEISCIFRLEGDRSIAYKRLPLFADPAAAGEYVRHYIRYGELLAEAGLYLPEDGTAVIVIPGRPVVLYIGQRQFPPDRFGHRLLHTLDRDEAKRFMEGVVGEISRVWHFNRDRRRDLQLAIDGQISNWVWPAGEGGRISYVDTSTPLFRINGIVPLDPELFLNSAPSFLRWIIRLFFLKDVMTRYFDERQVYIDLAANLYKEQRPDLIPSLLAIINRRMSAGLDRLTAGDVRGYYKQDRIIWIVFLAFRRLDRLFKRLLGRRYEFILPGRIRR